MKEKVLKFIHRSKLENVMTSFEISFIADVFLPGYRQLFIWFIWSARF